MTRKEGLQYAALGLTFAAFFGGLVVYGVNKRDTLAAQRAETPAPVRQSGYIRLGPEGQWRGEFGGRAQVIDGDTIRVVGIRLRLASPDGRHDKGIDAPEAGQLCRRNGSDWPCGADATEALRRIVGASPLVCRETGQRPTWGRPLVICYTSSGLNVNAEMVRQGWAVEYVWRDGYLPQHGPASSEMIGIWGGRFEWPWVWRRR